MDNKVRNVKRKLYSFCFGFSFPCEWALSTLTQMPCAKCERSETPCYDGGSDIVFCTKLL